MQSIEKPQFPFRYRWLVFALLAAGYFLVYFHRTSPAVVAGDMMRDMGADATLLGILGSAYFYPYALMQLPAGLLSDSWGPRKTITVFFFLAGTASILFGLAQSVLLAIGARCLVGLGVAMLFVPTMKVLTCWFRKTEFARMTGIFMAVGGIGVLVAAEPLAWMSNRLGWRGSFIAIGAATLILAVAIWFVVRNRPDELGYAAVEPEAVAGSRPQAAIGLAQGIRIVLGKASFWPLAIWFFFTSGIFFSFGGLWAGPFLQQVYGLTKQQSGSILNMLAVAMIIGSPCLSFISDKLLKARKPLLLVCSWIMVLLTAILTFWPAGMNRPLLYLFCFLLSLCSSAIVVIAFSATKELFPVQIAGTAVGLVNFFPFFGGAVMMPVLGRILDRISYGTKAFDASMYGKAFAVLFVGALVALTAIFFMHETHPDHKSR